MRKQFAYLATILSSCLALGQDPNSVFINTDIANDKILATQGNSAAATRMGFRHLTGSAGLVDGVQAYNYFAQAAPKWIAASAWTGFAIAVRPELGKMNINGLNLILQASNANDPVGIALMGRLYHLGKGVPQNTATARQFYNKAAPNFALAYTFLGETYLESQDPRERSLALPFLLNAAAAGEPQSMIKLATMYLRGDSVTKNYSQAANLLLRPTQQGDIAATYLRALLYYRGQGLPRSHPEAVLLFTRAATAGYAPAQADLGVCYAKGDGVKKDLNKAIYWLGLAAPIFPYAAAELALVKQGRYN